MAWNEIKNSKVRTFQLNDEPELIYIVNIRDNEYMVIHEDAYDLNTGNIHFFHPDQIMDKYGIDVLKKEENQAHEWSEIFQILSDGRKENRSELQNYDILTKNFKITKKN